MSSKRKSEPVKKTAKRTKKKVDEDYSSDLSDDYKADDVQVAEVIIPSDDLNHNEQLPEELLKTYDKEPGRLMIAGMITWDMTGRKAPAKGVTKIRPNLYTFQRFTSEMYRSAISGSSSAHSVLINMDRKALTFGRNQFGQLGQADLKTLEKPTLVPGLENMNIIQAACGRNHTLFLTDTGTVYACGDNKNGQCGVGNTQPIMSKVTRLNYSGPQLIKIGCGADFSMVLDIKGNLYSFGLPEYGQLGHNTDGKYFVTSTKMSFHFETSPKKVMLYVEKSKEGHVLPLDDVKIVDFSCGYNHTVAIDAKNRAFSWGFGGIGRLGHAEQKDEMVPRLIKFFDIQNRKVLRVFCGCSYSLAVTDIGTLYMFGQNKKTGEANMYPKPVQDLAGWNITSIGTGNTSIVISADDSLIAWGASPTYGELGLGDLQKSSSTPKTVSRMEGMKIPQVSMGYSHTLLLANVEHELTKQKYDTFQEFNVD
ncbi:protein RCC2 homolog [Toxorhynchites rutilus septentrionalis]|uniref:protein RCC2 homolog n=1 Tax=Toxorhynchites rutilus septentrionalis TaxID=329112 RepID=UPI00247B2470|nr:protein RCC2 homolog [Toxorhynchites rutilus septentrionalis]XP_055644648.1 protein RCC2 homolog [Toxorhynchites rutilus septentrionalis]XP_055644649.1 protein RCC2 homolog [Toxorhynchites rutilus septentrionalis]